MIYDIGDAFFESKLLLESFMSGRINNILSTINNIGIPFNPPFPKLGSVLFYFIFGFNNDIAIFINLLFFTLLTISTYYLGKKIKDEQTGLIAAIITSFIPGIYSFSRIYLPTIILTSTIIIITTLLLYSKNLKSTKISKLLGISLFLGIWTKITFGIYFLAILTGYLFSKEVKFNRLLTKKAILNILIIIIIIIPAFFFWYFQKIDLIYTYGQETDKEFKSRDFDYKVFDSQNLKVYYRLIKNNIFFGSHFFYIISFLAIIGLILNSKFKLVIILGIIIPIIFFSLIMPQNSRYILPIIPLVAISASITLRKIISNKLFVGKKLLITIIIIIILINQFMFLKYKETYNSKNDLQEHIERGMIKARNITDSGQIMFNIINKNDDYPGGTIFIIPSFSGENLLIQYNNNQGKIYDIYSLIFCIGGKPRSRCSDTKKYESEFYEYILSGERICKSEFVITLNETYNHNLFGLAPEPVVRNSQKINSMIEKNIKNFENCKKNYTLIKKFNIWREDFGKYNLLIYKKTLI
jgi:hypothetical protein